MQWSNWQIRRSLVETSRLELAPNDPGQILALVEADPKSRRLVGRPVADGIRDYLLSASESFFVRLRTATQPDPWRFGYAIIEKEGDLVIGMCGFTDPPNDEGIVEIAYSIAPAYQGKGYATEAARGLIEIAQGEPAVRLICAHTLAERTASGRVL